MFNRAKCDERRESPRQRRLTQLGSGAVALLFAVLCTAQPARAVYEWEILGGELEVTGFLQSEARLHLEDAVYVNQWIQRLQVESTITWEEVGPFDELAFTALIRPEFDLAYYYSVLSNRHIGREARRGDYLSSPIRLGPDLDPANGIGGLERALGSNDPVGLTGLDVGLTLFNRLVLGIEDANINASTGGLLKNVEQGLMTRDDLRNNFQVLYEGSDFPILVPVSQQKLDCERCRDVDDSFADVALNRTGSSGALYPVRELYMDATLGDVWMRIGKQQIVWGKTDFFRLQDLINPVDFGSHFFFDSFEDIRIPQWIASFQWRPGSFGPFTDTAVQVVWNFDEFRAVGLGNPTGAWAHPFGKQKGTFALFNTYFSPEPCLGLIEQSNGRTFAAGSPESCFNKDGSRRRDRFASGFGVPLGLSVEERPAWKFDNTEIGIRLEGRIDKVRFALTNYYGWGDTPAFQFLTVNVNEGAFALAGGSAAPFNKAADDGLIERDNLVAGLAEGIRFPVFVADPETAVNLAAQGGNPGAISALRSGNALDFYRQLPAPGVAVVLGGQVAEVYQKANTLGLALDYYEDFTGIVFRIESSWTHDELVNNTHKADWIDESGVVRFSIGMDRPTFIKFLNPTRTFFLSAQIFNTIYLDWEGTHESGFATDRNNWIYTFFIQGQYLRDRLTPQAFIVWEQSSGGWIGGFQLQYLISNTWSLVGGGNFTWEGRRQRRHDLGPFTSFTLNGSPYQEAVFGAAQLGAAAFNKNDELFFRVRYQF